MVRLRPEDQAHFSRAAPTVFSPVPGAWGQQGSTRVKLAAARIGLLRQAMEAAWHHRAPVALRRALEEEGRRR